MHSSNIHHISGVGIGLRHRHFKEFITTKPKVPWLEIHTENFFSAASTASKYLDKIRQDYPISAHCVGLSLGSASINCPTRTAHLQRVKSTIDRIEPFLISDHLSWSASDHPHYLPDLLPVPYTEEALHIMIQNINQTQDFLQQQILIENPSSYLAYTHSTITEWEFLTTLAEKTGCGILLDINNIYVNAHNHNFNASYYLTQIPPHYVKEIHLAGYTTQEIEHKTVFIDTHGCKIHPPVWQLYKEAITYFGKTPTLIEWDTNIPELAILLDEKAKADSILHTR